MSPYIYIYICVCVLCEGCDESVIHVHIFL